MAMYHTLLLSIDAYIGKFDQSSMSNQMRMELLVTAILDSREDKARNGPDFYDEQGDFTEASLWKGVTCKAGTDEISEIDWSLEAWLVSAKVFDFKNLPTGLKTLEISYNEFACTVDLQPLPEALIEFYVNSNEFHGTTNLSELPPNLEHVWFEHNKFQGSLALEHLPAKMATLYAGHNFYSGTLNFGRLPASMEIICAQNCKFVGVPNFERLPYTFNTLKIRDNPFDAEAKELAPKFVEI